MRHYENNGSIKDTYIEAFDEDEVELHVSYDY